MHQKNIIDFLKRHALLIVAGLCCELLYLFYFVRRFPLLQYYQTLIDIGGITHHSPTGFMEFVIALTIAFALFGMVLWQTFNRTDKSTLWLALGFGGVFAFTMIFVYPGTAIDVFGYIVQSIILVQHHANPMITSGTMYPHDPMMSLAGGWINTPSAYGPLALIIDAIPTAIVGRNLLMNLLLLKFMFSTFILIEAFLVYKILLHYAPKFALTGAFFISWNPYILFEYSADAHNDIMIMLFVTLAVLALVKKRYVLACALLITSILGKYVTLPLLPLFLLYSIWQQPTHTKRVIYFLQTIVISLLLIVIIYLPFWSGPNTLLSLLQQDTMYISSFATMLYDTSAGHIGLDYGKALGRIIFGILYLYALSLSTKSLPAMLRGCFFTLFFLLAFATSKFEIWYAIWPTALAAVTSRRIILAAAFLLTYGAALSNSVYQFLFSMLSTTVGDGFMFSNGLAYLIVFMPALLLLFCVTLKNELPFYNNKQEIPELAEKIDPQPVGETVSQKGTREELQVQGQTEIEDPLKN